MRGGVIVHSVNRLLLLMNVCTAFVKQFRRSFLLEDDITNSNPKARGHKINKDCKYNECYVKFLSRNS